MGPTTNRWVGKALAVVPFGLGITILWSTISGLFNVFVSIKTVSEFLSHILFFFACSVMVGFGVYFIIVAIRLWKGIDSRNLCGLSVIYATVGFCVLLWIGDPVMSGKLWDESEKYYMYQAPLGWIIAGLFYVFCNRSFHRWSRIPIEIDPVHHIKAVKWYFGILALLAITPLFNIIEPIGRQPGRDQNPLLVALDLALVIGVISIGWGIYRLGSRFYLQKTL